MSKKKIAGLDPEIAAIAEVDMALKGLGPEVQSRVLAYVSRKLGLEPPGQNVGDESRSRDAELPRRAAAEEVVESSKDSSDDDSDGISPVAQKWIRRNSLRTDSLSSLFSLGVDEIDLVAKTIPGSNKKERMRNVFLLKGVASYLSTGVARFAHEQAKEACVHYDAFDATNFATHLKKFASEISGSKEIGYSLTARGLSSATELVKSMLGT